LYAGIGCEPEVNYLFECRQGSKISSVRNLIAAHPKLLMFGFSLALTAVGLMVTGFTDHQAYARVQDQNTLVIPT